MLNPGCGDIDDFSSGAVCLVLASDVYLQEDYIRDYDEFLKFRENMIHPLTDCKCKNIPESTNIWQFCVIFPNAQIGENCNICSHCLIENDVKIGNNCTIKCGVQLWDGIELEDNVFIGPNTTFTNDMYPMSKNPNWTLLRTKYVKALQLEPDQLFFLELQLAKAIIGAGSVVTKSIPAGEIWIGNPARFLRKI